MTQISSKDLEKIMAVGRITDKIKQDVFPGCGFMEIRNRLEANGLNRHMAIELRSTEVAILTPKGIMMQIRPTDSNQLGMWGGVLNDGEEPEDGAVREIYEEVGIRITKDQLEFMEINEHTHTYDNGDTAIFTSYRYTLKLDYVPNSQLNLNEETNGAAMVTHTIISHQQNFIKRVLGEI